MSGASFEIIGDGITLDISDSAKLVIEFVATTFNDTNLLAGSYSYPVTFPFTPKNVGYFNHSQHLENREARVKRDVIIRLFGLAWKNAVLEYDISSKGFEGSLTIDNGAVAGQLRDKKLSDVFSTNQKGKIIFSAIDLGNDATEVTDNMIDNNLPENGRYFCWPTFINPMITGENNDLVETAKVNDFNNMSEVIDARFYSPMFNHVWILKEVCNWLGFSAEGSYLEDPFIGSLVIYNTGTRTGEDWKLQKKVRPAQHLPSISISDYLKAIRNDHRAMIYFDTLTKIAHFELSSVILESIDRLDLGNRQVEDSLSIKRQSESSFKLITKIDDSDELYKELQFEKSVIVGYDLENSKEQELFTGKPFMRKGMLYSLPDVRVPVVKQTGNFYSDSYKENQGVYNGGNVFNKNSYALRFLSYKGIQNIDPAGEFNIPYATSDHFGNLGLRYTQSLDQGGASGLINQFTLPYYQFSCLSEQVAFKAEMDVREFFGVQPLQKILLTDRNKVKVEALLDKVVFEPKSSGRSISGKITCYPNYNIIGGAQNINVVVGESEISEPEGTIYAKLFLKMVSVDFSAGTAQERCYIEFYADSSAAIPMDVLDLPYMVKRELIWSIPPYIKNKEEIPGIANGSYMEVGIFQSDWRQLYRLGYFLKPTTVDFVVIGNYKWAGNRWEVMSEQIT